MFQQCAAHLSFKKNKPAITNNYFVIYCRIDLLSSHEYVGANYLTIHVA